MKQYWSNKHTKSFTQLLPVMRSRIILKRSRFQKDKRMRFRLWKLSLGLDSAKFKNLYIWMWIRLQQEKFCCSLRFRPPGSAKLVPVFTRATHIFLTFLFDFFKNNFLSRLTRCAPNHNHWLGCPFFASDKMMRNDAKRSEKMRKQTLSRPEEAKLSKTKWYCSSFAYMKHIKPF
jgi:hypothetical protein